MLLSCVKWIVVPNIISTLKHFIYYSLPSLGRVTVLEDRSLKLDDITLDDMGEYTCEADNAVGSITATGTLIVHGK